MTKDMPLPYIISKFMFIFEKMCHVSEILYMSCKGQLFETIVKANCTLTPVFGTAAEDLELMIKYTTAVCHICTFNCFSYVNHTLLLFKMEILPVSYCTAFI